MLEETIDISRIEVEHLSEKAFPASRPFRIFIAEEAHRAIWKHARETLTGLEEVKEVGGILVGDVCKDAGGPFLEIKAAIVAEHTRNEGTEVAFTPETWEQVNRVKEERYPEDRIVGWYHTHPRFGIFLSERDQFIQRHSFAQPWATAFVVDPVQQTEGFFYWSHGEPKEAAEYWVGQGHRLCAPPQEVESTETEKSGSSGETKAAASQVSFALSVTIGLLSLLFTFGYTYWQKYKQFERDKVLLRGLQSQVAELDRTLQTLTQLRQALDRPAPPNTPAPQPGKAGAASPSPLPQVAFDPQWRGQAQAVETGLRRVELLTLLLAQQIAGQESQPAAGEAGQSPSKP